jgi:hypothetical protein
MSGKELFEAMSHADEKFVHEAENNTIPKRNVVPWMKWAAVAACLCLILLGAYNLYDLAGQGTNSGITSGNTPGGGVPVDTLPVTGGYIDHPAQPPAQAPTGEVPSVILRVDTITEDGFVATVAQLVDTDVFEVGMELKVQVAEGTENQEHLETGSHVMVQFIEYDRENKIIVINVIDAVELTEKGWKP